MLPILILLILTIISSQISLTTALIPLLLLILSITSITFRCALSHPIALVYYAVKDTYQAIRQKHKNNMRTGFLIAFTGLFGMGKTLSAVHYVVSKYKTYNNLKVYCTEREKFVTQKIKILSNVTLLSIPYEKLVSLEQVVLCSETNRVEDEINDTKTITLVLIDEASVQLNSRAFKTNIEPTFLNTLLTCRHYHIGIVYTAQRFKHVDKLFRDVTQTVIECIKWKRFQRQYDYDGIDAEHCEGNLKLIKPLRRYCWFVFDRDYNQYNTYAVVDNLKKDMQAGNMMTPEEVLNLRQNQPAGMEGASNPSRRWFKRFDKKNRG